MKSKLITKESIWSIYSSQLQWAFVKKVGENDYETTTGFFSCKDWMQELIANNVHKARITSGHSTSLFEMDFDKLQMVIVVRKTVDAKDIIYSVKKFFSDLEEVNKLPKTLIKELEPVPANDDVKVFLLTFKRHHVESPVLLHTFIALLRTFSSMNKILTKDTVIEDLNSSKSMDYGVLLYMLKNDLINLLLSRHRDIFPVGADLKEIYPGLDYDAPNNTCYHSGFGPVALQSRTIYSKTYADRLYKLLKEKETKKEAV